jgi:hypothetical protein
LGDTFAEYQSQTSLAMAGQQQPTVTMGRLGRRANPESAVGSAYGTKQAAMQDQLSILQRALSVLKIDIDGKQVEHGDATRRREKKRIKRTRAMNALMGATGAALVQRQRFFAKSGDLTASIKSLAGLLLPNTPEQKAGLIKLLKKHMTYLERARGQQYREPNSFKILQRRMSQLTADTGRHHLTAFKLAKILKDMAIIHYQVLHNGAKPDFTGGWKSDYNYGALVAGFQQPIEGDDVAYAMTMDDDPKGIVVERPGSAELKRVRDVDDEDDAGLKSGSTIARPNPFD